MKRNMTENSTRATAGYLPVLLFNQKKRARLPLTSNPMEHETGSNSIVPTPESFDSPPASNRGMVRSTPQNNQTIPNNYRAQFQYSNMRSNCGMAPVLNSAKSTKTSQIQQVPQHEQSQEHGQFSSRSNTTVQSNKTGWNTGIKQQLGNTWKESNRPVIKERKEFASTTGTNRLQMKNIDTFRSHISSDSYKAQPKSYQQMPQMFKNSPQNVTVRRHCGQQNQFTENNFVNNPEDDVLKKSKPVQMKFTQPDNSLRVLTTTIEGMKHWTQYNDRFALLFEVFATLDSAVISGEYSAKNFLLRDRKESVPCVFYETIEAFIFELCDPPTEVVKMRTGRLWMLQHLLGAQKQIKWQCTNLCSHGFWHLSLLQRFPS
ncbi:spermatogenesis-associated protein 22 isoform X2 [Narcine bancroftii]|uniref:spermatogenesis-associated protein 22 isoform X2 n=1 Tax=Narcine bancroftii TaxID=1343680 RepID=UPI0038317216